MANITIVSNRLPISVKKVGDSIKYYPSVGGLATALSSYTKDKTSKWVGWPGISSDETTEQERRAIAKELSKHNCYPVFLTKKQIDGFYNGFSNSILWPLFHNLPTNFDHYENYLKSYREVNTIFADAVMAYSSKQSTVWVHDYQLLLVPAMLRQEMPHNNIGLFLHIPFPDVKSFTKLKCAKQLVLGMLGADLVGFHTMTYTNYFLDATQALGIGVASNESLVLQDRVIRVTDFPISIDYAKSISLSNSASVRKEAREHRKTYGRKKVILTVDRLDPTKGLVQRLQAYRTFLRLNDHMHTKVVMVMLATPSRIEVTEYKELKQKVEALVTEINETFGSPGWIPIDYKYETLPYEKVVALYKIADVAFITPIRDGMNLVAKEYIASKQGKKGVLILSETAGAAEELTNAIIVNPTKRGAMAEALSSALTMPKIELQYRLDQMQKHISVNTVQKWTSNFVGTLQHSIKLNLYQTRLLNQTIQRLVIDNYDQAKKRVLLFDYDGTLVRFFNDPSSSVPPKHVIRLLSNLSSDTKNEVMIISGRSRTDLATWFKGLSVTLIAEHGSYIKKHGEKKWRERNVQPLGWKKPIRKAMEVYAARTPGAFVEEKDSALVWHFRNSPPYHAQKNAVILKRLLSTSLRRTGLKVYSGNKILEVKSSHASKGKALNGLINKKSDFILAIGDDYTDEDMFSQLPAHAFTIKVGRGRTHARFRLKSVEDVHKLLKKLIKS